MMTQNCPLSFRFDSSCKIAETIGFFISCLSNETNNFCLPLEKTKGKYNLVEFFVIQMQIFCTSASILAYNEIIIPISKHDSSLFIQK